MNNWPIKGFIPVMLTPFTKAGQIDFPCLEKLTNWYIDNGAVALFANCLSSEMFELSEAEALAVVQTVVRVTNKRVPILAVGTIQGDLAEMVRFSTKLVDVGVDVIVVLNNVLSHEDDSEAYLIEKFEEFQIRFPDVPLGIYECPVPYKRLVPIETLQYLISKNRFVYFKDTSLSLESLSSRVEMCKETSLGIYEAYLGNSRESLRAGASGLTCIQGNYFPSLITWLHGNFEHPRALQVEGFFWKHFSLMHQAYPRAAKYCLQKQGIPMDIFTRRNVPDLSSEICLQLDEMLEEYHSLFKDLI